VLSQQQCNEGKNESNDRELKKEENKEKKNYVGETSWHPSSQVPIVQTTGMATFGSTFLLCPIVFFLHLLTLVMCVD
jgi:hypothetical protein